MQQFVKTYNNFVYNLNHKKVHAEKVWGLCFLQAHQMDLKNEK